MNEATRQWGGQIPHGRDVANPAAWLPHNRRSRIFAVSAAASTCATARCSERWSVTVTLAYIDTRHTPAPIASSVAAWRARAASQLSRAVSSRPVRRRNWARNEAAFTSCCNVRLAAEAGNARYCSVIRLGNGPGAINRASTSEWTFWRGGSCHAHDTLTPPSCS